MLSHFDRLKTGLSKHDRIGRYFQQAQSERHRFENGLFCSVTYDER